MPPRKLTGKGARHRRAARQTKSAETSVVTRLTRERDDARGCPHGENCACAISSRHEWFHAFIKERERMRVVVTGAAAMQARLEKRISDLCDLLR